MEYYLLINQTSTTLLGLSLTLLALIIMLVKSIQLFMLPADHTKEILQMSGVLLITALTFVANNAFIYSISIFIIATLITKIEFLEKLMAMIRNSDGYWEYRKLESQNGPTPEVAKNLESYSKKIQTLEQREGELKEMLNLTVKTREDYEVLYHFEKTYRIIFNSQLQFVQYVQSLKDSKVKFGQALLFYENNLNINAKKIISFNSFTSFLINSYLIKYQSTEYILTPLGNLFVEYLKNNSIPLTKLNSF